MILRFHNYYNNTYLFLKAMKTLFRFLLLAIMFDVLSSMVNDIHAQTVRDRYNSQIGKVEKDGIIRDRYNSQIGKVERDGTVRDRYNSQVGKIESDGVIRDRYNSQIGKVERDGTVRDRYNSQIGKVERDGTVRDRYNSQIGKVAGIEPRIAAILFFMNLLQLY